jgi:hypothetical protein
MAIDYCLIMFKINTFFVFITVRNIVVAFLLKSVKKSMIF